MMSGRADAVVIQGSLSTKRIADLAVEHRLPAASTTRAFVDAGGLMSYGADGPALFRHGAKFVQRILQGRQPNDLPIEQPTKFELASASSKRVVKCSAPSTQQIRRRLTAPQAPRDHIRANADNRKASRPPLFEAWTIKRRQPSC
jgi:hypothetical protein